MGDAIGILLVIAMSVFFVDSMFPGTPWFPEKKITKDKPITRREYYESLGERYYKNN
jgi:hypothetical protein